MPNRKNILITGIGSGLGEALVREYLANGDTVYAIGRTFPSARKLKESHIQTPKEAAKLLISTFNKLLEYESGSFLDVRTIK